MSTLNGISVDFLKSEYTTLREEIKESKSRRSAILIAGIGGPPVIYQFIKENNSIFDNALLALPLIVFGFALLYLGEHCAVMRAGTYIKYRIEPFYHDLCGWERWMSCEKHLNDDFRMPDKYSYYAFLVVFLVYFTTFSYLAIKFILKEHPVFSVFVILLYYAAGVCLLIYIVRSLKSDTDLTDVCEKVTGCQRFRNIQRIGTESQR